MDLADRVRSELGPRTDYVERAMFGGLAFMVNTHMACGIIRDDLMVRVGKEGHDEALAKGALEMDFTGRPMRGMVLVPGAALDADALAGWVDEAIGFAQASPPKQPKQPKPKPKPKP